MRKCRGGGGDNQWLRVDSFRGLPDDRGMGRSCSSCGYKSQNRAFFRPMSGRTFGLNRWFCLGCKPVPTARPGFASLAASVLLAVLGWLAIAADGGVEFLGYGFLVWSGFIFLTPLTLAVHEIGHAAVAALLGRRVYQINIGSGRPLKSFEIRRTQLVVGRNLSSGYVVQIPLEKSSRWGDAAILMAGATANFIAAIVLMFCAAHLAAWSEVAAAFVAGSILSNCLTGFGSLIPRTHDIDGALYASDGRQILQLLRRPRGIMDWQVHHDAVEGGQLIRKKRWEEAEAHYRHAFARHPDQPGFLGVLMHVLAASKGYEAAMRCAEEHDAFLRQEGHIDGPMAPFWSYAWGMAAWTIIRSPTGDFVSAKSMSHKATQAGPAPYSDAVQGAILAKSGEREKGLYQIIDNLKGLGSPDDKLEFCDFIIAERLENPDLKVSDFQSYADHLRTSA